MASSLEGRNIWILWSFQVIIDRSNELIGCSKEKSALQAVSRVSDGRSPSQRLKKDQTSPKFLASQVLVERKGAEEEPARSHQRPQRLLLPGVHGKEQLRRRAVAPHESFCPEANDSTVKKVNCFGAAERRAAGERRRHGVWDTSKRLTDFSIMK